MDNKENILGLYPHNQKIYHQVEKAFQSGEKVVGIVEATGAGKTYNALQLAYDHPHLKIVFLAPSNSILEHIQMIIEKNPDLDFKRDFPNLQLRTYQSLLNLSYEEIETMDIDLLILDEFHHIGAPIWGSRVDTILEKHPAIKVFGMTAYTVRDRKTVYERDMANPNTEELFSNKIVARYDLCDAIIDGVLPKPIYRSAHIHLLSIEAKLEKIVEAQIPTQEEQKKYWDLLEDIKKRISSAPSLFDILKRNIKPSGKYIYFCPLNTSLDGNGLDTIMQEVKDCFKSYIKEEDIVFYKTLSKDSKEGKKNRDAFYKDQTMDGKNAKDKLRIIFAVNQYNEGVHAPNVDGVIMGRGTTSDIVFFEQLGRALSVRGDHFQKFVEYEKYTKEELLNFFDEKEQELLKDRKKEDLIEKLIAPVVIDLAGNIDFIKELENDLKDRIREKKEKENIFSKSRKPFFSDVMFDIAMLNQELFEILKDLEERLTFDSWDKMYFLVCQYYQYYKNLQIPGGFKTKNGYEYNEEGSYLGKWLIRQYQAYKNGTLSEIHQKKLENVGVEFDKIRFRLHFEESFSLAQAYYLHYKDSWIPYDFKTKNGYEPDPNGFALGHWMEVQRARYRNNELPEESKKLLESIEINAFARKADFDWDKNFKLAKAYLDHHGDLNISQNFCTKDGYTYDADGFHLGQWLNNQKHHYRQQKLTLERQKKLEEIGVRLKPICLDALWDQKCTLLKVYHQHYKDFKIPKSFRTTNGYEQDDKGIPLGQWLNAQYQQYAKGYLSEDRKKKLEELGLKMDTKRPETHWDEKYELAKIYYQHHGNLAIPARFRTQNGYESDPSGVLLGKWFHHQLEGYKKGILSKEHQEKLEAIGAIFTAKTSQAKWQEQFELVRMYCQQHGGLWSFYKVCSQNGSAIDPKVGFLNRWIQKQYFDFASGKLSKENQSLLESIGIHFKEDTIQFIELCRQSQIDFVAFLLRNISFKELEAKLAFLKEKKEPIYKNGNLHEIFSMDAMELNETYGISYEQLLDQSFLSSKRK